MMIEVPNHYLPNLGGALVSRAAEVIQSTHIVPGYLHQFADMWNKGMKYGYDGTFWEAVENHMPITRIYLERAGVL